MLNVKSAIVIELIISKYEIGNSKVESYLILYWLWIVAAIYFVKAYRDTSKFPLFAKVIVEIGTS